MSKQRVLVRLRTVTLRTVTSRALAKLCVLLSLCLLAASCGSNNSGSPDNSDSTVNSGNANNNSATITVFAASSLATVMDDLTQLFEESVAEDSVGEVSVGEGSVGEVSVQVSLAGSSTLREQLLAGAPADVFIPADASHLTALSQERAVLGQSKAIAKNTLALAVPAGNEAGISGLANLARSELLVGLCAEQVPCGALALAALSQAGIEPQPDTHAPNVSALATQLAAGELDVGIVYFTNTLTEQIDQIDWVTSSADNTRTASSSPPAATYVAAVLADSPNLVAAQAFVDFLTTPAAQMIFERHGFLAP